MSDVSDLLAVERMRDAGPCERLGFTMHYYRWLERLTAALRDDMLLILEHKHGIAGLDRTIANCEQVMQQLRGDFAAIVKAREKPGE